MTKYGWLILSLGLSIGLAGGQLLHCSAETNSNSDGTKTQQSGAPVRVHSDKEHRQNSPSNIDAEINKMRGSASNLSLPSSMFEPWWRTMLHDPDADWILRNFDVITSDPEKCWAFPVGLGAYIPRLDTTETKDDIKITAEVPGIDEKNLDVTVTDDSVTIKGDKKEESTEKDAKQAKGLQSIERSYGSFERTIALPCKVDSNNAQAILKNGILTVTVPKTHVADTEGKKLTIRHE
jgi:HSP20 family molecular chaperone IbpA